MIFIILCVQINKAKFSEKRNIFYNLNLIYLLINKNKIYKWDSIAVVNESLKDPH